MLNKKIANIDGVTDHGQTPISIADVNGNISRNKTRSKGMREDHVQSLVDYIRENGVDETIPVPVLERIPYEDMNNPENVGKKFYIVDGNHRIAAFTRLGMLTFDAHLISFRDETAREDAQTAANNHPPQLDADISSVVDTLSKQIKRGDLVNEKSEIRKKVGILYRGKKKGLRDAIVAEVVKNNGSHEQWLNWSEEDSASFLMDNYGRTTAFGWDADREVYGAVMKAESEYRTIARAIEHFNEVGPNGMKYNPTEVVICAQEKGNASVQEKRQSIIDTANEFLDGILEAVGASEWANGYPIRFVGALPQDLGSTYNEDAETLIMIDADTDEILVH